MQFAPEPGVHSAHRGAHDEPGVIDSKSFREQTVIGLNHVNITVMRKFCVHSVARFTRFAVTDPVRQHNEKFCRIQRLIFSKQLAGKFRANKLRAAADGPVHDENGIGNLALRVFLRCPQCSIMET